MSKNKLVQFVEAGLPRTKTKISDGRVIKIRAFAVKELKLLMMANASESAQDEQVLQVLEQCIETVGIDVKSLPSHDIELLFIDLYKISKGTSIIPVKFRCTHTDEEGKICGSEINCKVNLNNVTFDSMTEKKIELSNGLTLNMRYPNILEREYFNDEVKETFNLAMRCIESVDTGSEVMVVGEDVSGEEIAEVIEYLDETSFTKLMTFVTEIPTVTLSMPLKCPSCGHTEVITLKGLADFFD